jgi:oxygen-independent coproporphyrinogen-3 oxidase
MEPHSLYLHIPFCLHRCAYCDFNTYAGFDSNIPAYVKALIKEVEWVSSSSNTRIPVHTVYFGGGTPSLLKIEDLEEILSTIRKCFSIEPLEEITLEVNPGTVDQVYLNEIVKLGINRLSLGLQSANVAELRFLERIHTVSDVIQTIKWARKAALENISIDLIYGLPAQTLEKWRETLSFTLRLSPDHLSLYSLTIEEGTPMKSWLQRGMISAPDPDMAADMYELAGELLDHAGFKQYEISNWGRFHEGVWKTCKHNLQYWRGKPYLGIGAGAHGYTGNVRTINTPHPLEYIQRMAVNSSAYHFPYPNTPATEETIFVTRDDEMGDYMMMALRLVDEGVNNAEFKKRFGFALEDHYSSQINRLVKEGLLELIGGEDPAIRLTEKGRLLGNRVFMEFICKLYQMQFSSYNII